jgi:hypothetical protein
MLLPLLYKPLVAVFEKTVALVTTGTAQHVRRWYAESDVDGGDPLEIVADILFVARAHTAVQMDTLFIVNGGLADF